MAVIPENKALASPSMLEIFGSLREELLIGKQQLNNQVDNFVIVAMNVPNFLNHLGRHCNL